MMQNFGPPLTTEQILAYHRKMDIMKNHANDCNILTGTHGTCTCSFANQPGMDIFELLNRKGELERECDHYLEVIEQMAKDKRELEQEIIDITEYPWGAQWTYWFTAMIAGGAAMVGLIVGQWLFG